MTVLLYMDRWPGHNDELVEVVRAAVPGDRLEIFRDQRQLESWLARPALDCAAVVLAVGSASALQELAPLRDRLARMDLLMVLPHLEKDLAALGHGFFPRLLTSSNHGLKELGLVLSQLIERNKNTFRLSAEADPEMAAPGHGGRTPAGSSHQGGKSRRPKQ